MRLNSERYTKGPKYNLDQKKLKEKELIKTRFCNSCKKDIEVEFVKKTWWRDTHKFFYKVKETGKMWSFGCCPKCKFNRHIGKPYRKANGRTNSTNARVLKGVETESVAVRHLQSIGFKILQKHGATGPDVVCSLGDHIYTVEVKPAIPSKDKNSWSVFPVYPKRKNDDLIAIVLPNGLVHLEDMASHHEKCCKWGKREVVDLVKEIAPNLVGNKSPVPHNVISG